MTISPYISRFIVYLRNNGCRATGRRILQDVNRALFVNRTILFYCDLSTLNCGSADLSSSVKVERRKSETEVDQVDLQKIVNFWNPKHTCRQVRERFEQGASLWIIKSEGNLAGYGWSLQGRTIAPHYFPLGRNDVHLFDFLVFPQYRGRRMNPLLVTQILCDLVPECRGRAFIEAAEWNHAQLSSLQRTPFRRLGGARKLAIFRRAIVGWDENGSTIGSEASSGL